MTGQGIGVWVTSEQFQWLQREATRHSVSLSALIRAMIVDAMEETDDLQRGSAPGCEGSGKASEADGATAARDNQDDHEHSAGEAVGL